jgi:hypothetical protein
VLNPRPNDFVTTRQGETPRCLVVVDAEEDFDWSKSFSRQNVAVDSMRAIHRVQDLFERVGVTPVYVVDYPIATQADAYRPLQEIHASGRCLIGAHLHPWVNPPFTEVVNRRNSFPGNLPPDLESAKLAVLGHEIGERFGVRPTIYKAGRYGVGPQTADMLEEQGYEVDVSVCPYMDYSAEGGPDFSACGPQPYWFGRQRRLLELPLTVGFAGALRRWGRGLHRMASHPHLTGLHLPGVLARLGLVEKLWLSPEGHDAAEHKRLVRAQARDGLTIFTLAFHSPSVVPGNTPYVRTEADLREFLARCREFFDFFFGDMGGRPTTPDEVRMALAESVPVERVDR